LVNKNQFEALLEGLKGPLELAEESIRKFVAKAFPENKKDKLKLDEFIEENAKLDGLTII